MYTMVFHAEVSLQVDRACQDLDRAGIKYRVVNERELAFRKVCRKAKQVLSKHGLERVPTPPEPVRAEDLERLFIKHGRK